MVHVALLAALTLPPEQVVQEFYDRYLKGTAAAALAAQYFTADFAKEYRFVVGAQDCMKGDALIDYDPFFNTQENSVAAVAGVASVTGASASVPVKTTVKLDESTTGQMMVKMSNASGEWRIADFINQGGDSFRKELDGDIADYHKGAWKLSMAERRCIAKIQ